MTTNKNEMKYFHIIDPKPFCHSWKLLLHHLKFNETIDVRIDIEKIAVSPQNDQISREVEKIINSHSSYSSQSFSPSNFGVLFLPFS